jgi:hypothetical protein
MDGYSRKVGNLPRSRLCSKGYLKSREFYAEEAERGRVLSVRQGRGRQERLRRAGRCVEVGGSRKEGEGRCKRKEEICGGR